MKNLKKIIIGALGLGLSSFILLVSEDIKTIVLFSDHPVPVRTYDPFGVGIAVIIAIISIVILIKGIKEYFPKK